MVSSFFSLRTVKLLIETLISRTGILVMPSTLTLILACNCLTTSKIWAAKEQDQIQVNGHPFIGICRTPDLDGGNPVHILVFLDHNTNDITDDIIGHRNLSIVTKGRSDNGIFQADPCVSYCGQKDDGVNPQEHPIDAASVR